MLKNKMLFVMLSLMLMVMSTGCQEEKELSRFEKPYVVYEEPSLPYFDSQQDYNGKPTQEFIGQLVKYDGDNTYLLVDNKGKVMEDEEFARNRSREFSEEMVVADKMKNYPLFIVQEGSYYVTTVEQEVKALFDGERVVLGENLDKVLEDNKEAYESKDYESIMIYLSRKQIKVYQKPQF